MTSKTKTTYYLIKTDAENVVMATDGSLYSLCAVNPDGTDTNTGVLLYAADEDGGDDLSSVLSKLKPAYAAIDGLYTMSEIAADFPADVYPLTDGFESLIEYKAEIITVE